MIWSQRVMYQKGCLDILPNVPEHDQRPGASPARTAFVMVSDAVAGPGVQAHPVSLTRTGRSRRQVATMDVALTVAILASGENALESIESCLLLAEDRGWPTGELPARWADRHPEAIGLTLTVPVALARSEPTGPIVTQPPVIQVAPTWRPVVATQGSSS